MRASRTEVINTARTWIGTRWRHQGRVKGIGVDCIGLIVGVARELGLSLFDTTQYRPIPDGVRLRAQCEELMTRVTDREPLPGDVCLMQFKGPPQHLGFVSTLDGRPSLIHAYVQDRKVVEHYSDLPEWIERVVAFYAIPGVE